jgi:hypothetical protein
MWYWIQFASILLSSFASVFISFIVQFVFLSGLDIKEMLACWSPRVSLKFVGRVWEWLAFIPLESFGGIQDQHYLVLRFSGLEHFLLWIQSPSTIILFRAPISSLFKHTRFCICSILWISLTHSKVQTKNCLLISLNPFYFCKISSNILSSIFRF